MSVRAVAVAAGMQHGVDEGVGPAASVGTIVGVTAHATGLLLRVGRRW